MTIREISILFVFTVGLTGATASYACAEPDPGEAEFDRLPNPDPRADFKAALPNGDVTAFNSTVGEISFASAIRSSDLRPILADDFKRIPFPVKAKKGEK